MDPFDGLTLARLRSRQGLERHCSDSDVLPRWVAETDVLLAEPVREVLQRALRDGDGRLSGG